MLSKCLALNLSRNELFLAAKGFIFLIVTDCVIISKKNSFLLSKWNSRGTQNDTQQSTLVSLAIPPEKIEPFLRYLENMVHLSSNICSALLDPT